MREIKLRYVWERPKSGHGAYRPSDAKFKYTYLTLEEIEQGKAKPPDTKYVLITAREQHTGLKDSQGREIYEGDIISHGKFKGTVYYREGAACFKIDYWEGWHPPLFLAEDVSKHTLEVIGNIHENPELDRREAT